jgi:hypothetical protein
MSEYPCTGIDKAILKFALQDRKISQIVSVKFSIFFRHFSRQLLPEYPLIGQKSACIQGIFSPTSASPTKLTGPCVGSFWRMSSDKKMAAAFFQVIFIFYKADRTFFLHRTVNFIIRFI